MESEIIAIYHGYQYLQFLRDNDAPWIMEDFFLIRKFKFQCFDTYDLGFDPFAFLQQGSEVISSYVPTASPIWKVDTLFLSKSVEDIHLFDITWNIPPIYMKRPEQFLVIALSHKKGWLISLEALYGDFKVDDDDDDESKGAYACNSGGRLFSLSLELTNLGSLKMRLDMSTKSFNEKDLTEPFFNTSYTELKFSSQFINPCYEPGSFQFPPPNPFLPTVLPLPAETDDDDDEAGTDDESDLLVDKPNIKLWHSCDESVPTFNLSVLCKIGSDLRSQALGVFYLHLLKESLAPILSQGKEANLNTSITLSDKNKVEIKTSGFKERFHLYISTIWNVFTSFSPSADSFVTDKEIVGAGLVNNISELSDHSDFLLLENVSKSCYSVDAMLRELKFIDIDEINRFISDLRSQHLFLRIVEMIKKTDIPKGSKTTFDDFVRIKSDINSLAKVSFQIGTKRVDAQKTAVLHLFFSMIEENLIYWLSMKNKLGFEVGGELQFHYGINLFSITVEVMEANVFGKYKKTTSDEYPDDDGENLWQQITEKRRFRFNKRVRSILKNISQKDVVNFYKRYLVKTSPQTRMLSIRIWGCNSIPCAWSI
ncbi:hypothetical protein F2Q70_00000310 [Brassica cretica]|uniref:Peptidase M16 middle/third domain-containing protein n=1 Tax=Brassica cretica TaxID=69181 RepID=A0A8S9IY00_BRACR|nr:hypothetical protein F2Q70_00000310 [Brassica cretica]